MRKIAIAAGLVLGALFLGASAVGKPPPKSKPIAAKVRAGKLSAAARARLKLAENFRAPTVAPQPQLNTVRIRADLMGVEESQVLTPMRLDPQHGKFGQAGVTGLISFEKFTRVLPALQGALANRESFVRLLLHGLKPGKRYLFECQVEISGDVTLADVATSLGVTLKSGGLSTIAYVHEATTSDLELHLYGTGQATYGIYGCDISQQR
ncbi:MAG: hypothetical protein R3B13_33470 [Polyangiaceae bacterium]